MGNCLDKSYSSSDESDENVTSTNESAATTTTTTTPNTANRSSRRSHRTLSSSSSSANRYMTLIEEASASASSLNQLGGQRHRPASFTTSRGNSNYLSQSFGGSGAATGFMQVHPHHGAANRSNTAAAAAAAFNTAMSSSLPISGMNAMVPSSSSSNPSAQQQQVFYLTPNTHRTADQLTEEEQIKLLKRMTLIQQLPTGSWDENKKHKECVICMIDFEKNDTIKYLPCMHTFHQSCIDTWLLRSLICPSCMEPVDAGLLAAYE